MKDLVDSVCRLSIYCVYKQLIGEWRELASIVATTHDGDAGSRESFPIGDGRASSTLFQADCLTRPASSLVADMSSGVKLIDTTYHHCAKLSDPRGILEHNTDSRSYSTQYSEVTLD